MYKFSFEKLEVWKNTKQLTLVVYHFIESFLQSKKYGLTSQIFRASVSISSNLAEGTSRKTKKDKAHFTTMAYSSLMKLLNQIIISKDLSFLQEQDYEFIRKQIDHIANQLNSLRKYQLG